jgi:hypothetical protein
MSPLRYRLRGGSASPQKEANRRVQCRDGSFPGLRTMAARVRDRGASLGWHAATAIHARGTSRGHQIATNDGGGNRIPWITCKPATALPVCSSTGRPPFIRQFRHQDYRRGAQKLVPWCQGRLGLAKRRGLAYATV